MLKCEQESITYRDNNACFNRLSNNKKIIHFNRKYISTNSINYSVSSRLQTKYWCHQIICCRAMSGKCQSVPITRLCWWSQHTKWPSWQSHMPFPTSAGNNIKKKKRLNGVHLIISTKPYRTPEYWEIEQSNALSWCIYFLFIFHITCWRQKWWKVQNYQTLLSVTTSHVWPIISQVYTSQKPFTIPLPFKVIQ